jgi:hypothetical protein
MLSKNKNIHSKINLENHFVYFKGSILKSIGIGNEIYFTFEFFTRNNIISSESGRISNSGNLLPLNGFFSLKFLLLINLN